MTQLKRKLQKRKKILKNLKNWDKSESGKKQAEKEKNFNNKNWEK